MTTTMWALATWCAQCGHQTEPDDPDNDEGLPIHLGEADAGQAFITPNGNRWEWNGDSYIYRHVCPDVESN